MFSYLKGRASKLTYIHVLSNSIGDQVIHANDHAIDPATNGTYEVNWHAFLLENISIQSQKMS